MLGKESPASGKKSLGTMGATVIVVAMVLTLTLVFAPGAWATGKYKSLHRFSGRPEGSQPVAGLVFDAAGSLYGTTYAGGASNSGTVFKLTPKPGGGWSESVLYSFCPLMDCGDGAGPIGVLLFDPLGNLYGTTFSGGNAGSGVVFKLTPHPDGSWSESVLYKFRGGQDGNYPDCGLVFDQAGNLYGTTTYGGTAFYHGTVFKLTPNPDGSWTESVIHSFTDQNGSMPHAGVIFDAVGNLYGTTVYGGNHVGQCSGSGCGVVFELTPNLDQTWSETVLYAFTGGKDGDYPNSGLIFDQAGNLYGAATGGGHLTQCKVSGGSGCGVVFELTPNPDQPWTESVLHSFSGGRKGINPDSSLVFDSAGSLYGTTIFGGDLSLCKGLVLGCGVVFKLAPNSHGGWSETVLHRFYDHPGASPYAGVTFDAAGNLYGTTSGSGGTTLGSVFEITP
jgi:uncharacterized repeat protein (TIGR03803 family)